MSQEKILSLALELAVLLFFAGLYYLWQKRRILYGPKNWQRERLVTVYHAGVNCLSPELFRDLTDFLNDCEKQMASSEPWLTGRFLSTWKARALPTEILETLAECDEWYQQAQRDGRADS
ncbi:MAG: hypothetical protein ACLGG7_04855 [Bacteriovoracia bacterium]